MKNLKQKNGITLVALIITIIVLLILAGVTLTLILGERGILNRAQKSAEEYSRESAREKLEVKLADMHIEKLYNSEYNQNEYLTQQLINEGFGVNGNIVTVDGWEFEIDRSVPKIGVGEESPIVYTYAKTGLQVYLDGNDATTRKTNQWDDISGKDNHATLNGCTWNGNKLTFDGIDDWANLGEQDYGNLTIEIIFDTGELLSKETGIIGNWEIGGYGIVLGVDNIIQASVYINNSYKRPTSTNVANLNTKYKATLTSNGEETKLYINGELKQEVETENGLIEMPNLKTLMCLGTNLEKDMPNAEDLTFFKGSVYLVRVYNRALSENEVKQNYNYDNERININGTYFDNVDVDYSAYTIASVEDLETFRDEVDGGNTFEGQYIELTNDIDLASIGSWNPIGDATNVFKGIFNGNGHTIKNLNIDNNDNHQGLFANNAGVIESLNIDSDTDTSIIKGTYRVGAIAGQNTGVIINCSNELDIDATEYHVGGICGYNLGNIQKCYNNGDCSTGFTSLGGITGRNDGLVKFCHNNGLIESTSYAVGGIAGTTTGGTISSCYNTANVTTTGYSTGYNSLIGGILGSDNSGGEKVIVKYSYNSGNITGAGSNTGGIVGLIGYSTGEIFQCYNTGDIESGIPNSAGTNYAGGIAGTINIAGSEVNACYNTGAVTCDSGTMYPGGIVGYNMSGATVLNCYTLSTKISTTIGNNKGTATNVSAKTPSEMMTSEFINLIGTSYSWYLEGGYPKLRWE